MPLFFLLRMTNAPVATPQTMREAIRPVSEEPVWEIAAGAGESFGAGFAGAGCVAGAGGLVVGAGAWEEGSSPV